MLYNSPHALPSQGGIGLKPEHYAPVLAAADGQGGTPPAWLEVHPQNYFCNGGPAHRWLGAVAEVLPLSFHSTGLSLGSAEGPDLGELTQLALLVERYQPASVSDHLSWSNGAGQKFPDLLPIPYSREALAILVSNIDRVQQRLKRRILIENPSRYLAFADDNWDEVDFIHEVCRRAGCGLLLDINNVEVSASNLGFDARAWLDRVDVALVDELHLAGHATEIYDDGCVLKIDDHGSAVSDKCWDIYSAFIARAGPRPTLIERDTNLPDYEVLVAEALRADELSEQCLEPA